MDETNEAPNLNLVCVLLFGFIIAGQTMKLAPG